ncbi:DUF1176 domain-containing protein [Aestuariivirga litoralis]|uniref:DUF1176 domain-containing protein n=1 Tax=Aestuariivirga litoralis TaxID=2650924 RepID=UPI0018C4B16B|nr:DUF1176 domain-containing protein [Aestuariivirga litoralis]MBG1231651.1 DUF1176 domain-containing protein [Aestuariivirga litoralis]
MRFKLAAAAAILSLSPALAADPYLDDRSNPEALVRSLYSAINLQQYSRAYTYFSDPPAKDYETYAKGYEDTAHVDLLVGDITGEGAAGHTFSNVPIAIRAKDKAGKISTFAGCYVVVATNADQDPPYQPLRIQSAKLKPIKADDFDRVSLPKCGDIPPDETTVAITVDDAKAKFASEMKGRCDKTGDTLAGLNEPEHDTITFKAEGETADDAPRKAELYLFSCQMAAYNESFVAYLSDDVEGLRRISFAQPHLKLVYEGEGDQKLKSLAVDGYQSTDQLTNAEFDSKTGEISEFAKWRGIGDASSSGTWKFVDGQFVLKTYDVDATYDENENPVEVIKDGKLILKP